MRRRANRTGFTLIELPFDGLRTTHQREAGGFTLIELLVVIAIISLLVSILLPSLSAAKDLAKLAACASNLHSIGLACAMYVSDDADEHVPPPFSDTTTPYYNEIVRMSWESRAFGLGLYYYNGYVDNPRLFYCPAQPAGSWTAFEYYESWPSPGFRNWGNGWVTWVSYDQIAYWGVNPGMWHLAFRASEYADPSLLAGLSIDRRPHGPQLPYIYDLLCNPSVSASFAHGGKWNVLFIDAHVGVYAESGGGPVSDAVHNGLHSWPAPPPMRDYFEEAF